MKLSGRIKTGFIFLLTTLIIALYSCSDETGTKDFGDPPTPETCFCDPDGIGIYLDWINTTYPDISVLRTVGKTEEGRDILAVEISDEPGISEAEPVVLINGAIHGHEQAGAGIALKLLEDLTSAYYNGNTDAVNLVDNYKLHFIPAVNPDGLSDSSRYNSNGVDLNRNFGYNWYDGESYNGDAAFDQDESQAIRDDMLEYGYCLSLNFHTASSSTGIGIYGPWDAVATDETDFTTEYLPNYAFIEQIGEDYSSTVTDTEIYPFNQYFHYQEGADWYPLYGSMADWALSTKGTLSYSIELYAKQNYTTADDDLLEQIWNAHKTALLELISKAELGTGGRLIDASGNPVQDAEISLSDSAHSRAFIPQAYPELKGMTDANGYFRILTGPGDYHITFSSGGQTVEMNITIDSSGGTDAGDGSYLSFPSYTIP